MKTGLVWAVLATAACGGSGSAREASEPREDPALTADPATGDTEQPAKLARFEAQKQGTCAPMCERLTECSIESLRANEPPEKVAQMELDKIAPIHTEKCSDDCNRSNLSPRQVQVIRTCLSQPLECQQYVDCLDGAKPQ